MVVKAPASAFKSMFSALLYDRPVNVATPLTAVWLVVPLNAPVPAVLLSLDRTADKVTTVDESAVAVFW